MANIDTPFSLRVKREWMWKQVPPMTRVTAFANAMGISQAAADLYLNRGRTPEIKILATIAQRTGISFLTLLRDCNYPIPESTIDADDFTNFIIDHIKNNKNNAYTRDEIITIIQQLQQQFLAREAS